MKLRTLPYDLSVCKVPTVTDKVLSLDFFFICHTDEEVSLVCKTEDVPDNAIKREDGWRAMRFEGVLDLKATDFERAVKALKEAEYEVE